ncbi:ImmA/IrrE family metallo-endopeptidase [Paraburkholderia sp. EG304]|uniref:ImmA/IrrE family metallo-endopeptidase n=1 Tax=Paraburkholderia sp. EG304 TaxID=3237015 RepID=UPI00397DA0F9
MMEQKARELVLRAMDEGWAGPPFDPLALAKWRHMRAEARGDIPDARTVPTAEGELVLQYNPTRPRGRLRFSIAHEIAHSLFPDCAEEIRHRDGGPAPGKDNWQLEVLCNIGAAELLMPLGSFSQLTGLELSMQSVN